jgi:nucleotide-binding universal stress UspA family protein
MRELLLHGGADEAYDRSVAFARRLAESFGARLHIVYTVDDSVGWTEEVRPEQLPAVHQAIEEEARERLARLIPIDEQERRDVQIALRMGPAERELIAYTEEHKVDLAILHVPLGNQKSVALAQALIDHGRCAVLVLR